MKKYKVRMSKMNTPFGSFPVIGNFAKLNRSTVVYFAYNGPSSIFYLVRPKDVTVLQDNGYTILSAVVPPGRSPIALSYDPPVLTHSIY